MHVYACINTKAIFVPNLCLIRKYDKKVFYTENNHYLNTVVFAKNVKFVHIIN